MGLGKILANSAAAAVLSSTFALGDEFKQEASLIPSDSDRVKGAYVDFVESFIPGKQITMINWEGRINNILGKEKRYLRDTLSLGHYGEVVVSYTHKAKSKESALCFRNNDDGRPVLYVHEANDESNRPETVEVFVTPNKNLDKNTKWISLGVKSIMDGKHNWIPFYMPIDQAYHVKLRDAGSKLTTDFPDYAGFDASAVLLTNPCRPTS